MEAHQEEVNEWKLTCQYCHIGAGYSCTCGGSADYEELYDKDYEYYEEHSDEIIAFHEHEIGLFFVHEEMKSRT